MLLDFSDSFLGRLGESIDCDRLLGFVGRNGPTHMLAAFLVVAVAISPRHFTRFQEFVTDETSGPIARLGLADWIEIAVLGAARAPTVIVRFHD
jgi:hypothetical protein